jgi:NTP pyrophosphatase (non-canonical NTP hydrolase)
MERFTMRSGKSLAEWQEHLAKMYHKQNDGRRPLETFARVVEMCSGIARGIHRSDVENLSKFAPRALAWLIGVANQLHVNLEEAVWFSYPGVCPHCRQAERCVCRLYKPRPPRASEEETRGLQAKHQKPKTIFEWQSMFYRIYGPMNEVVGEAKCLAAFLEELGELSEMIRFNYAPDAPLAKKEIQRRLEQELSDMFAWYCGVCNFKRVEIDAIMKDVYQAMCPECNKSPCECHPDHAHAKVRLSAK